jgi:hypothetical protein
MDASNTFLMRMFLVFFIWTHPTSSMAKPACMKKTRIAPNMSQKASASLTVRYLAGVGE